MNTFSFVGQIVPIKDSEKFHPIERKNFESGWTNTVCRFNVVSGTNRIMCMVQGGKWADDSKNSVKTVGQKPEGGGKRELITIPWDNRFDKDQIDKVAGFRHCVVDLDDSKKRYKLRNLVDAFKKKNDVSELVEETGCDTIEQAKEALTKSENRRHVFITVWDFAEYMTKVVTSEKIKGKTFRISGNQEVQYSNGNFYRNYVVNRVELIDAKPSTSMIMDFYFADDCVKYNDGDEVAYINGWSTYYDSGLKKNGFFPITIASRGGEKEVNLLEKKLSVGNAEIANIGLVVDVIDGAEMTMITMDDLDETTRTEIEEGWLDFKEVVREMGGNKIGDRIAELRFSGLNPRKRSVEETTYSVEDMKPAVMEAKNENTNIFDEDDEDI